MDYYSVQYALTRAFFNILFSKGTDVMRKHRAGSLRSKQMKKGQRSSRTASKRARTYIAVPPAEGWRGGDPAANGWRRSASK